jgi:hypothetical protein
MHTSQIRGYGHPILATLPAFIRNLLFPIFPDSFATGIGLAGQEMCDKEAERVERNGRWHFCF